MPKFDDYDAYAAEDEDLVLPIHGKEYRIPPMRLSTKVLLTRVKEGEHHLLDDMSEADVMRLSLGNAYDQMVADDITVTELGRAHVTAAAFHEGGPEVAKKVWDRSIDPELGAALGAALKTIGETKTVKAPQDRKASTRSSSTGAAPRTPSRASTSGTRSRKGTRPAAAKAKGATKR